MKSFHLVCGFFLAGCAASAQQYIAGTVAGTLGSPGWSGDTGPALSAQFQNPLRVAVDAAGNLYISDYSNHSVREVVKATGLVTSLAGNGSLGFSGDGGSGVGSGLSAVLDIAVDATGNVYIADSLNHRVRRVDTTGIITTFAGNGTVGSPGNLGDGGPAANASLSSPAGLGLDTAGNLYIADSGNGTVRKITVATGVITTIAGLGFPSFGGAPGDGGPATSAFLGMPYSVEVDAAGNIYIGDIGTSSIRKIGLDGNINTYLANFTAQNFAMDAAGAIYYADYGTNTVHKVLPGGTNLQIAGNGTAGSGGDGAVATTAQFSLPYGVAVDARGRVYVADSGNAVIRQLTPVSFSIGAVANAGSLQSFSPPVSGSGDAANPISPGEIIVLFGTGLGPDNLTVAATQNTVAAPQNKFFPTQVANTQVMINNQAAPLIYVSSTLVAAIVPYSVYGLTSVPVSVVYQGAASAVSTVPVAVSAPGIFTANSSGSGPAAALNQNGSPNSASNPAQVGSVIVLYATGEGQTSPGGADGKLATDDPNGVLPKPLQTVSATIGGLTAIVNYAGAVSGEVAGLIQVNVQIPAGVAASNSVPVVLQIGGANSPPATIAVSAQ